MPLIRIALTALQPGLIRYDHIDFRKKIHFFRYLNLYKRRLVDKVSRLLSSVCQNFNEFYCFVKIFPVCVKTSTQLMDRFKSNSGRCSSHRTLNMFDFQELEGQGNPYSFHENETTLDIFHDSKLDLQIP